jgi:hypothetical protein
MNDAHQEAKGDAEKERKFNKPNRKALVFADAMERVE